MAGTAATQQASPRRIIPDPADRGGQGAAAYERGPGEHVGRPRHEHGCDEGEHDQPGPDRDGHLLRLAAPTHKQIPGNGQRGCQGEQTGRVPLRTVRVAGEERAVAGVEQHQCLPGRDPEPSGHHQQCEEARRRHRDSTYPQSPPPRIQHGRRERDCRENRQREGQNLRVIDELPQHAGVRERPTARCAQVLPGEVAGDIEHGCAHVLQARGVEVGRRVTRRVIVGRAVHEGEVHPGEAGAVEDRKVGVVRQQPVECGRLRPGDRAPRAREGRDDVRVV
jgi:hypothetical protein